LCNFCNQ